MRCTHDYLNDLNSENVCCIFRKNRKNNQRVHQIAMVGKSLLVFYLRAKEITVASIIWKFCVLLTLNGR